MRKQTSWYGSTVYKGREFIYVSCMDCGSLYCDKMPDNETLLEMYGIGYAKDVLEDISVKDKSGFLRTAEFLRKTERGVFIDYGCGKGSLLKMAKELNWKAIGVEFSHETARDTEKSTGVKVFDNSSIRGMGFGLADILHLGDVIEHFTDIDTQMQKILKLIKPGGILIAQGPLDNNRNLFIFIISIARKLLRKKNQIPPYHTMLATSKGQRTLFNRLGLEEVNYCITEVAWPAPDKLLIADLMKPRLVGLFILRCLSQFTSRLLGSDFGNRYFYAGKWSGII
ncbi:class I SAM-dependent methyltransferase [Candidatus Omnitrophota bacterium]